jgi:ABC-type transport system involved in multi-copper enzyme maturation permease subunit
MSAGTAAPYRTTQQPRRGGFMLLLSAEWTKFRSVRGWVIGLVAAMLATVFLGVIAHSTCSQPGTNGTPAACSAPVGPGGEAVTDSFYFVHQPLPGNGSITVQVTSLTGQYGRSAIGGTQNLQPGIQPWSKAGVIIKADTAPGSSYAAMMVTGDHGVRMQYDYTYDQAGLPGAVSASSPRWLRLVRSGDLITGYESTDGTHWTQVAAARLNGLPATVQVGLFATSPRHTKAVASSLGVTSGTGGPSQATAGFDHVSVQGAKPGGSWAGSDVGGGADPVAASLDGFHQAGGSFTVSGSGDIAPAVSGGAGSGSTIAQPLVGTFIVLIVAIILGVMFITTEYRSNLVRSTLTASPRRGQVLVAKAIVIGAVVFVAGLAAAALSVGLGERTLRSSGNYVYPVTALTGIRVVAGTAALLAVAAVLALAIGALTRRSAQAVTAVIVVIVLPYLFAIASVLPAGATGWLLRVTPAAAFAIQQTLPRYPQVTAAYTPANGYYPLAPWGGFAVLCAWAAAALVLAFFALRRRDA